MTVGAAWVDGRVVPIEQASVPVTDRGFLLGDAVFETLRTRGGLPFLLGEHLDRLRRSAVAVAMPVPWTDAELDAITGALLPEAPAAGESVLRLTLTRGDGGHGLALPEPQRPRLVVLCRPLPELPGVAFEQGVAVALDRRPLGRDASVPAHVKAGNYLGAVLALRAARQRGAVEALIRGPDGGWIEGTSSNLFALRRGVLLAPGEGQGALPGITRALVLALAWEAGLPVQERSLSEVELEQAEELFVTSTVKGILPLVRLDDRPVGEGRPGPRVRALLASFDEAVVRIRRLRASRLCQVFPDR